MERGYVKLWRSIDQNELLENDNTALVVFTKLLTRVDRRTGAYRTGRLKLANICNMKPSTLRDALKRLEAATIVRQQSDSRATTIYICNWSRYQQEDDSVPSRQRRSDDTKQEKKENKDTNVSSSKALQPVKAASKDIDELFELWEQVVGTPISGQKTKNRYACSNLLRSHGKEKVAQFITGVALSLDDEYAPSIADFIGLQANLNRLITWGHKRNRKAKVVEI